MTQRKSYTECWNAFVCPSCNYTESIPADQQRNHMSIPIIEYGGSDDQYAKYQCQCGEEAWSFVEPWTPEECGA